jgi:V/A-type H+-transporting ATPase subunit I
VALVKMKKIQLAFLKTQKNKVLDFLQEQEVFSSLETAQKGEKVSFEFLRENEKKLADLSFVIKNLKTYYEDQRDFSYFLMGEKEVFSENRVKEIAKQLNYQEIVKKVQEKDQILNELNARKIEISKNLEIFEKFKNLNLNLEDFFKQSKVFIEAGVLKTSDFSLLEENLKDLKSTEIIIASQDEKETSFVVIYYYDLAEKISNLLRNYEVKIVSLPQENHLVKDYLKDLDKEKKEIEDKIKHNVLALEDLAIELPKLKACYDYFLWNKDKEETFIKGYHTEYAVIIEGFVKAEKLKMLQLELEQITQAEAYLQEIEIEENENIPVEIENHPYLRPFEAVTRLYGLPKSNEVDPTPYLAVFFFFFFGFCLTDAVYGVILALLSFVSLKIFKVPRDLKPLLSLIGLGGIGTIIMGVLFGGYAGITLSNNSFLKTLQVFDFNTGLEAVMLFAFLFGFLQLWVGTLISGVHNWKQGFKKKAFFLDFSWTVFFVLIGLSQILDNEIYANNLSYIALIFLTLSLSFESKGLLKIVKGPLAVVEGGIDWLSKTMSYARLFALGLSTGVIAIVFNSIAQLFGDMMPWGLNYIVMFLIIIFGHLMNIAMNSLGSFIHSARLQFVEFFSKFMEGGGVKFEPLMKKSKYVYLEDNKL